MGLRERFRLEEAEGDALLYVGPLTFYKTEDEENRENLDDKTVTTDKAEPLKETVILN